MIAMLPFVYGIKQLAEHGLSVMSLGAMALGVVGGLMFVRRQITAKHPLIDIGLFSDRVFSGAISANLLSMVGYAGFLFFAAQFLQLVVGLEPDGRGHGPDPRARRSRSSRGSWSCGSPSASRCTCS